MKKYIVALFLIFMVTLSAKPQFSAWRFVNQDGETWNNDISDIYFEAELIPGSGDIQTLNNDAVDIVFEDIGNGTISSFIVFNFSNFVNPWQPADLLRIKMWNHDITMAQEIIVSCSFISEAPYPFYGWETEGFGEAFAAPPLVVDELIWIDE